MTLMGEAEWFIPLASLQVKKHLREEHLSEIESVFVIVAPSEQNRKMNVQELHMGTLKVR